MTADTHACTLYCDRPECIRRQRDALRDLLAECGPVPVALERLLRLVSTLRRWHYHWPDYGGPPAHPTPGPLVSLYNELQVAEHFLLEKGINVYARKETKR